MHVLSSCHVYVNINICVNIIHMCANINNVC